MRDVDNLQDLKLTSDGHWFIWFQILLFQKEHGKDGKHMPTRRAIERAGQYLSHPFVSFHVRTSLKMINRI